jgi:ankyrin repeat protein
MTTADAFAAIENGDLDALTTSLDAGTDPNASDGNGYTLLMLAIWINQLHMVDMLLSRGADVHQKDRAGWTALHVAAAWGNDVFRKIFSAAGPRAMNFQSCNGQTPLHYLACYGSAEIAFALTHPGIDTSIRDREGRTALEVNKEILPALQTYGDQEARWQPTRYTWIKFLILPNTAMMRVS